MYGEESFFFRLYKFFLELLLPRPDKSISNRPFFQLLDKISLLTPLLTRTIKPLKFVEMSAFRFLTLVYITEKIKVLLSEYMLIFEVCNDIFIKSFCFYTETIFVHYIRIIIILYIIYLILCTHIKSPTYTFLTIILLKR